MGEKKEKPIVDYCCGAYSSDAGCCPFENQRQAELFPDAIREQAPPKRWIDITPRKETRPLNKKEPYEIFTVPDWVKEKRNRDTDSNLD